MDGGFGNFPDYNAAVMLGRVPGVTRVAALGTRTISAAIAGNTATQSITAPQDIWAGVSDIYPWMTGNTALEAHLYKI